MELREGPHLGPVVSLGFQLTDICPRPPRTRLGRASCTSPDPSEVPLGIVPICLPLTLVSFSLQGAGSNFYKQKENFYKDKAMESLAPGPHGDQVAPALHVASQLPRATRVIHGRALLPSSGPGKGMSQDPRPSVQTGKLRLGRRGLDPRPFQEAGLGLTAASQLPSGVPCRVSLSPHPSRWVPSRR